MDEGLRHLPKRLRKEGVSSFNIQIVAPAKDGE